MSGFLILVFIIILLLYATGQIGFRTQEQKAIDKQYWNDEEEKLDRLSSCPITELQEYYNGVYGSVTLRYNHESTGMLTLYILGIGIAAIFLIPVVLVGHPSISIETRLGTPLIIAGAIYYIIRFSKIAYFGTKYQAIFDRTGFTITSEYPFKIYWKDIKNITNNNRGPARITVYNRDYYVQKAGTYKKIEMAIEKFFEKNDWFLVHLSCYFGPDNKEIRSEEVKNILERYWKAYG